MGWTRWDCLVLFFLIGKDTGNKLGQGDKDWKDEGETEAEVLWRFLQNTAICHKPLEIIFLSCVCVRAHVQGHVLHRISQTGVLDSRGGVSSAAMSAKKRLRFSHFYHTSLKCSS